MKTRLIRIGNSQGVRIPKPLIEQTGLGEHVELTVEYNSIAIRTARRPRESWEERFREMARNNDDVLLDRELVSGSDWDEEEWEWQ